MKWKSVFSKFAVSCNLCRYLMPPKDGKEGKEGKEGPAERVTEALLILKFGGVLTHLGKNQAEFLGGAVQVEFS
jgi:hypothetical protein